MGRNIQRAVRGPRLNTKEKASEHHNFITSSFVTVDVAASFFATVDLKL